MTGDAPHGCGRCAAAPGQDHLSQCEDRPKRQSERPDWRDMGREAFDTGASFGALFDLTPGSVPADDGHGTADLFTLN